MNKITWIFFDLDGTLIDSLSTLYNVYISFLKDYGVKGNRKEFEKLNGPKLDEIVTILKNKYNLNGTKKNLLKNYHQKASLAYKKIQPNKHVNKLLKRLNNHNYKLALVTSSPKNLANLVLENCKWKKYFRQYTYGDEVTHSKPHPDIYKLCLKKTKAKKREILVVEDSNNGYKSATNAGLKCILLNKKQDLNQLIKLLNGYEQ